MSNMDTPHIASAIGRHATPDSEGWSRLAGLLVGLYVLGLLAAMFVVPVGLVVAFDQPVLAAFRTTLLGVVPGYVPLLVLALGES